MIHTKRKKSEPEEEVVVDEQTTPEQRKKAKHEDRMNLLKKQLFEAKEERDSAKRDRDMIEAKRDNMSSTLNRLLLLPEGDSEKVLIPNVQNALSDAQTALRNAENHYGRLLEQVDALQSATLPSSPSSSEGSRSSRRKKSRLIEEATEEVQRFWKHLPQAQVNDNVLQLVEDTCFLGDENLRSDLYIREHYEKLYTLINKLANQELEWQRKSNRRSAILGTPGIGKTFFLYWLLWKLRLRGVETIIVHAKEEALKFSFDGSVLVSNNVKSFRTDLKQSSCWYLVDGVVPYIECKGITILASSPDRTKWYELCKQRLAHLFYMPLFTLDELLECQKACFPGIEGGEVGVRERFIKYGGMARAVLEVPATGDKSLMKLYENATSGLPDDFVRQLYRISYNDHSPAVHRVVHMEVTDLKEYSECEYRLATPYQVERIFEEFWQRKSQDAIDFVTAAKRIPWLGQMRGKVFELAAHYLLSQGGRFRVRNLDTGVEEAWDLPRRELVQFRDISEISDILAANNYARPLNDNLESVDSIVDDKMLQMAARDAHPVTSRGLEVLLRGIDPPPSSLVFVVPSDKFAGFGLQRITGERSVMVEGLEQYVMEIELP